MFNLGASYCALSRQTFVAVRMRALQSLPADICSFCICEREWIVQPVVSEMKQTMEFVQVCRHPYAVG